MNVSQAKNLNAINNLQTNFRCINLPTTFFYMFIHGSVTLTLIDLTFGFVFRFANTFHFGRNHFEKSAPEKEFIEFEEKGKGRK